ncbi:hypothetical protein [Deinococcus arcticus]|uniref:hypothetical protein n=1 Tax=Deinococcus arcticus TaxID=2136176 RepID=UPI0018EBF25C|nr:hypothetical protein [Deinococcus arcticus]
MTDKSHPQGGTKDTNDLSDIKDVQDQTMQEHARQADQTPDAVKGELDGSQPQNLRR